MSEPADLTDAPNDPAAVGPYAAPVYAFAATDGFVMERQFEDIALREADAIQRFDVTNAVQVTVAASVLNAKLGTFDTGDDCFKNVDGDEVSAITFTSDNFRTALASTEDVISVGSLSTLYSDFKTYVGTYFGFNGGFETLFAAATEFVIDGDDAFDADSLVALIAGTAGEDPATPYTKVMTGSITISNITRLLRYAVDSNCFGNRVPSGTDPTDATNFGVNDGFLANDLIWVPAGIEVTLKLAIDAESFNPINNRGPNYVQDTTIDNGNFQSVTSATTTLITREVKVPMLIRLK